MLQWLTSLCNLPIPLLKPNIPNYQVDFVDKEEKLLWTHICIFLLTVFPLLVYLIPTPNVILITKEEYLGLNFEIFLRLKVYTALLITGLVTGVAGANISTYRSVFIKNSEEDTGWFFALVLDLFIVVLILSALYSMLLFIRILVNDFENAVLEFVRYMDILNPALFFTGLYIPQKIKELVK